MKSPLAIVVLFAASTLASAVGAQVTVRDAWIRGTVQGQKVTGAFMQLTASADTLLVGATSPIAKTVEIHEMKNEGGLMKMRPVTELALPAGKTIELTPGGYHVMLFDLTKPLTVGETVPLVLMVADKSGNKQSIEVAAKVRPLTAGSPASSSK